MNRAPRLELDIHTPRPAFDLQSLSTASKKLELLDLRLRAASFERTGDVDTSAGVIRVEMRPEVILSESGAFVAGVEARVRAFRGSDVPDGGDDGDALLTASAAFEVLYAVNKQEPPTDAELAAFVELNPAFNCWPYLREFVEGACGKLGMRRVTLPLFRIGDARCVQKRASPAKRPATHKK